METIIVQKRKTPAPMVRRREPFAFPAALNGWIGLVQVGAAVGVTVGVGVAATLLACACVTGPDPVGQTGAAVVPKVLPWLEVNAPMTKVARWFPDAKRSHPDLSMRDYALEGMAIWAKVTDTVIVSSRPNQVQLLYPYLMRHKPTSVRIIGGLKTFNLPGGSPQDDRPYDFADAQGWRDLADRALEVVRLTQTNVVLLDNETTLARFTSGAATINYERLRKSLEPLQKTGIIVWWNLPRILDDTKNFPDRRQQTQALIAAIHEALPTAVFLDGYTAWYDVDRERPLRKAMIERVGFDHMQPRLLVTPDGFMHYPQGRRRRCFTPVEAIQRIREMKGHNEVNVYTGGAFWVAVAVEFAQEWANLPHP